MLPPKSFKTPLSIDWINIMITLPIALKCRFESWNITALINRLLMSLSKQHLLTNVIFLTIKNHKNRNSSNSWGNREWMICFLIEYLTFFVWWGIKVYYTNLFNKSSEPYLYCSLWAFYLRFCLVWSEVNNNLQNGNCQYCLGQQWLKFNKTMHFLLFSLLLFWSKNKFDLKTTFCCLLTQPLQISHNNYFYDPMWCSHFCTFFHMATLTSFLILPIF